MVIPGLGAFNEHVAVSPGFDPARADLSDEEAKVVAAVGRVREISEVLTAVDQDSNLTIAALLSLRAKGIIVKARVSKSKEIQIDTALMDHPSVQQVVTFAMPPGALGEEVAAAVVLREGQSL